MSNLHRQQYEKKVFTSVCKWNEQKRGVNVCFYRYKLDSSTTALPNIGGTSVRRRKVWLSPTTRVSCSNAAETRNPLKCAGVPQTPQPISAASGPTFNILWGRVEETLLFNKFFLSDCRYVP